MVKLQHADQKKLIDLLTPLPVMQDKQGRDSVFIRAGIGDLRFHINLTGPAAVVVPSLIDFLCKYGEVDNGDTALGLFLRALDNSVGKAEQAFLDEIIKKYALIKVASEPPSENPPEIPISDEEQPQNDTSSNYHFANSNFRPKPIIPKPVKPFSMTMNLRNKVLTVEGLYTDFFDLDRKFLQNVEKLINRSKRITERPELEYSVEDLETDFITPINWAEPWHIYIDNAVEQQQTPCFVFKTPDPELLDFPIELVKDRGEFISLTAPMYKEMLGFKRQQKYHPFQECFSPDDRELNLLLVASSFEGQHQNSHYQLLPLADEEVQTICRLWLTPGIQSAFPPGRLVVLSNNEAVYADWKHNARVNVLPATAANFERALSGQLGCNFQFFHYSGHYIYGVAEEQAGFLFGNKEGVEFFNLARLRNALRSASIQFAYLSACGSGQHREQGNFLGVAYTCLKAGVPVVIGMRWPLRDSASLQISRYFYEAFIASACIPELALQQARIALENEEGPKGILWAAPIMLTC